MIRLSQMFRIQTVSFLLFMLCVQISPAKQSEGRNDIVKQFGQLIQKYRYSNPDSAAYFAQRALKLARQKNDKNSEAYMINQLGMIDDNLGRFGDSREKYLTALSLYQSVRDSVGIAAINIRLGVVEMRKGNYSKATEYYLEALKVSTRSKNKYGTMEAYTTLGESFTRQKKYDQALTYLKKAEELNSQLPFSSLTLNIYNDFGMLYTKTKDYKNAIFYLKKGIEKSDEPQYHGLYIYLMNNLAIVHRNLGNYQTALKLQRKAYAKAVEIDNFLRETTLLTSIATTFEKTNRDSSLAYYSKALELATKKGAHKLEIDILNNLASLKAQSGDYAAAYKLKNKQYALADSFFYKDMSRQINNLQADYELTSSKAKVKELRYLNQQQQLKENVIIGIAVGVGVLFLVVGLFLYRANKLNQLLNKANFELQESNHVKDKIFSVLAHDLRSPFTSAITLIELINEGIVSEEDAKKATQELSENFNSSLGTLNQLLRWGEMQIKGIRVNPVELDVTQIVSLTIAQLATEARNKSIKIDFEEKEVPFVFCDADHFEFVIRNIISNAIKFTPNGGVINVQLSQTGNDGVKISIRDNGIGIPKENLERIFSVKNTSTKGTNGEKGTSLGLVMCKEFIENNGGKIEATSTPGIGSEFIITLSSKTT